MLTYQDVRKNSNEDARLWCPVHGPFRCESADWEMDEPIVCQYPDCGKPLTLKQEAREAPTR